MAAKNEAERAMMAQNFIAEPSNERRAAILSVYKRKFKQAMAPCPRAPALTSYLCALTH